MLTSGDSGVRGAVRNAPAPRVQLRTLKMVRARMCVRVDVCAHIWRECIHIYI